MNIFRTMNTARANLRVARMAFGVAMLVCPLCLGGCGDRGQTLEEVLAQEQLEERLKQGQRQEDILYAYQDGMTLEESYGNASPSSGGSSEQGAQSVDVQETGDQTETLWVHICGYVKTPGIYELSVDSRIYDGLMAAGGFAIGADETALNLADYLQDGMQIYVPGLASENGEDSGAGEPAKGRVETIVGATGGKANNRADAIQQLININTATQEELESLPGIGESRARDIIAYRESQGPFESIEDIQKISGIKTAIYTKIKDLITVGK